MKDFIFDVGSVQVFSQSVWNASLQDSSVWHIGRVWCQHCPWGGGSRCGHTQWWITGGKAPTNLLPVTPFILVPSSQFQKLWAIFIQVYKVRDLTFVEFSLKMHLCLDSKNILLKNLSFKKKHIHAGYMWQGCNSRHVHVCACAKWNSHNI